MTASELLTRRVARFADRRPDWDAFADARVEGFRRAQHRYIGSGASGKPDPLAIPPEHFTLSVMLVPPGQGNAPHTHEVEEVFFVLEGTVLVFFQDAGASARRRCSGAGTASRARRPSCTASRTWGRRRPTSR
jgi:mannose-6-phosphate isomerase-like protein (cupin superfamily)